MKRNFKYKLSGGIMSNIIDLNIKKEIEKYKLTDKEFKDNVNSIFNELSIGVNETTEKQFIIVGGQAGSGKTNLVHREYQELKKNAIILDQDELRTKFPPKLTAEIINNFDERTGYLILRPYIINLLDDLMKKSREKNYNVIFETALSRIEPIVEYINNYVNSGYKIKLSILAVNELEAKLSMLYRYCCLLEKDGFCRRATKMRENSYNIILENINTLLNTNIFEKVEVYTRNTNNMNGLPIKIYSTENILYSPKNIIQSIKNGELGSYREMKKFFYQKYDYIKKILNRYGEYNKIIELEDVLKEYQMQKDKEGEER